MKLGLILNVTIYVNKKPDGSKEYNYSLRYKIDQRYGVQNYLSKLGYDVSGKGYKMNKILIRFLKAKGLRYQKMNPKYKGDFGADMHNAITVQHHWADFVRFIRNEKNKENGLDITNDS